MENLTNEEHTEKPDAIVINIQSWSTPIVGLLMLVIGLLAGYYGRPLLAPQVVESPATGNSASSTSPTDENVTAQQAAMMQEVVSTTRHFKGDPSAPVTIIEFSDFQ